MRTIACTRHVPHPPEAAFRVLEGIGGPRGYLFADSLWRLRGAMDRAIGGTGMEPGRRSFRRLRKGERFDYWIVDAIERGRSIELRTTMRLPGRGWLRIDVDPEDGGSVVTLTASMQTSGAAGDLYWFALYPIHAFVFRGMLRRLVREAGRIDGVAPRRAPFRPRRQVAAAPCRIGCPAGNDVRAWVGIIAQRDRSGRSDHDARAEAFRLLTRTNPFPAITGRVCPHPCEDGCNRAGKDGAVAVHLIERHLGDWALQNEVPLPTLDVPPRPESIGVLGSGPAGLSFAYQMARRGYAVTVYEREPEAGGMLRYGIPRYRLPRSVLDGEIRRVLDTGVRLEAGVEDPDGASLARIRARHDAVFLGIGAGAGRGLPIPGGDASGVWTATGYLRRIHLGQPVHLGPRVAVVGGGDTAIDAARVARRQGADVTILYRRSLADMPAAAGEIDEAIAEGIRIVPWRAPVEIRAAADGDLHVAIQAMEAGEPDASGRARPIPVDGSLATEEFDAVLAAVAQEPDWTGLDDIRPARVWAQPDEHGRLGDNLWTGGDVTAPGTVASAIGWGRRAAESMDARLRGRPEPHTGDPDPCGVGTVKPDLYPERPRIRPRGIRPADALHAPEAEVHPGIDEREFDYELSRCLSCGRCFGCEHCWTFCAHGCFERLEEAGPGAYFIASLDACRGCGKCVDVCPSGYLRLDSIPD